LPRKRLFRLRKRQRSALAMRQRDTSNQINACEKPALHRGFRDVLILWCLFERAQEKFSAGTCSMQSIAMCARGGRGTYTQY
jgi:hypothetical protein